MRHVHNSDDSRELKQSSSHHDGLGDVLGCWRSTPEVQGLWPSEIQTEYSSTFSSSRSAFILSRDHVWDHENHTSNDWDVTINICNVFIHPTELGPAARQTEKAAEPHTERPGPTNPLGLGHSCTPLCTSQASTHTHIRWVTWCINNHLKHLKCCGTEALGRGTDDLNQIQFSITADVPTTAGVTKYLTHSDLDCWCTSCGSR